jgi:hypothetical protein
LTPANVSQSPPQVRAAALVTSAILPFEELIEMLPVASGCGSGVVPPEPVDC